MSGHTRRPLARPLTAAAALLVLASPLAAQVLADASLPRSAGDSATPAYPSPVDPKRYSLFRAVPHDRMRGLATDRPGAADGPVTLDAGHFQVEVEAASYGLDRSGSLTSSSWGFVALVLKAGLTPHAELQLAAEPHRLEYEQSTGAARVLTYSGAGAVGARLKLNAWGNDGGRTALALIPYLTLARTAADGGRQLGGGLSVPLALDLGRGWSLGTTAKLDLARAGDAPVIVTTQLALNLGFALVGPLRGYTELASVHGLSAGAGWSAFADGGLTLVVHHDVQLDAGLARGLTRSAEDWHPFLGVSVRY